MSRLQPRRSLQIADSWLIADQSFSDFPALATPDSALKLFDVIESMCHDFILSRLPDNSHVIGREPDHGRFVTVPDPKKKDKEKMKGEFGKVIVHEMTQAS